MSAASSAPHTPQPHGQQGLRIYDELIAVHAIMRRGTPLVTASFARLAGGEPVDVKALVGTARWLIEFVHHHHQSEDELFWPVLRDLFPAAVGELDRLTREHEALDAELETLSAAVDAIAAPASRADRAQVLEIVGRAALTALPSAERVDTILTAHLDEEEPVLLDLFPQVPDDDIVRLRKAIVRGAPRTGPHLVLGLMEDPDQTQGYAHMMSNFPAPVRWLKPVLLGRYRATKRALGEPAA
jgi:hemerythrin-like domain-containing protein